MTARHPRPADRARAQGAGAARSLAALACALVLALLATEPARAQEQFHNPFSDLMKLFTPAPPSAPVAPPAKPRKRVPAAAPVSDRPAVPKVEPTVFVAVVGDSLADMLGAGLTEAFDDNPEVQVLRRARPSSGLVRDDFYDWLKAARELAAGPDRITQVVVMLGSNDRQAIRDAQGTTLDPFSDGWKQVYASRVEELVKIFQEKQIPVYWVGMPIMENPRFSADMLALNEISRAAAEKAGATWIDLWEPFMDAQNRYAASGPDVNGDVAKLRAADGVHFTKAGARKAAHFVETEIKRAVDQRPPASVVSIPTETVDPASSDPTLQPGGVERIIDDIARRGIDGDPIVVTIPVKPAAGPVLQLTGVEPSPGGDLLQRLPARGTTDAGRLVEEVLVQGRTPEPKPGRADDFRWPPAR